MNHLTYEYNTILFCLQIVGMPYLHETLGPVINEIYADHKLIELDPGRIELLRK